MAARGWGYFGVVSGFVLLACGQPDAQQPLGEAGTAGAGGSVGQLPDGTGGSVAGNGGAGTQSAHIQTRLAAPAEPSGGGLRLLAFSGGAAERPGLESLEYHLFSIQICESMTVMGSGFSNPNGCLELYRGDHGAYAYELDGDWTPLAETARGSSDGFVDLLDPTAREALGGVTVLTPEHIRSYHYGIVTWALPIKVKASVPLADGSFLYTHDGVTTMQTIGSDGYRDYFTVPTTSLSVPPAETAVVLHGNGGNWFKFQNPLTITQADIDERREWVLDLVFNPEGIVKGFASDGHAAGNLREQADGGGARGITVPMLDLAPIPHRAAEHVVRESYRAHMSVGSNVFDARIELYSVEGDPNATVYGVEAKTLVTRDSTSLPPEFSKISFVVPETDGSLSFQSFNGSSIVSAFRRVEEPFGTTVARVRCATHADRAGAEGGAAIVVDSCPSEELDVTFTLMGRSRLDGEIPIDVVATDAGAPAPDSGSVAPDAG